MMLVVLVALLLVVSCADASICSSINGLIVKMPPTPTANIASITITAGTISDYLIIKMKLATI
jgi:hypothetical protein